MPYKDPNSEAAIASRRARNARYRERHPERRSASFRAWWENGGRELRAPGAAERTAAWRKANPERRRMHDETRRARMGGSRYVAAVLRLEVFRRDAWVCWLCGTMTLPGADYFGARPSIDHVVPLHDGGEHTLENLRCAHVVCNARRGLDDHRRRKLEEGRVAACR